MARVDRRKLQTSALLAAVLLFPILANYDAYRGYFEDDDLDTLTWARVISPVSLIRDIPSIRYPPQHIRPVSFLYYSFSARAAGLNYPPWLFTLQIVGLVNVAQLWLLLGKLGLDEVFATAGCLFFVAGRALFDAWWKPMFVYDVLCTMFVLASVLAYTYRRWVLSFIAFWLAARSKEIGIVVPVMLLAYEMILGERKWKRVLIFLLPAAIYGGYGVWHSRHLSADHPYRMDFEPGALWKTASFYASKILWIPYAGFLLLVSPFLVRDRRIYFGAAILICGIAIYLVLPGRVAEVYLYLPMIGAAVMVGALTARYPRIFALLAIAWIPWQVYSTRQQARATLAEDNERRALVEALRAVPDAPAYVYTNEPPFVHSWGIEGALRLYHRNVEDVHRLFELGLPADKQMELLSWDAGRQRFQVAEFLPSGFTRLPPAADLASWQVPKGWEAGDAGHRVMRRAAAVDLYRPAEAKELFWEACADQGTELRTFVNGLELLPAFHFAAADCVAKTYPVTGGPGFFSTIDFLASPPEKPVRMGSFGFR